jgi:hypothetical protein
MGSTLGVKKKKFAIYVILTDSGGPVLYYRRTAFRLTRIILVLEINSGDGRFVLEKRLGEIFAIFHG